MVAESSPSETVIDFYALIPNVVLQNVHTDARKDGTSRSEKYDNRLIHLQLLEAQSEAVQEPGAIPREP